MTTEPLPRIAIATGDPAGIGPEISLKAALDPAVRGLCRIVHCTFHVGVSEAIGLITRERVGT
jgi:4-hydroxy-L-threonine phosphate dehydrogenase PdxA